MAEETEATTAEETEEKTYEDHFEEFANAKSSEETVEAVVETTPAEENLPVKEEEAEGKQEETPDELALAKEETAKYKKDFEDMKHRYDSDAGRVSALQKQINDQNEKIDKLSKKETPTKEQVDEALESEEDYQEFKEEFPKAAAIIEKKLKAIDEIETKLSGKITEIDSKIVPVTERVDKLDAETYETDQIAALEKPREEGGLGHPDWREDVKTDEFKAWVPKQHEAIFNLCNSPAAKDMAAALDLFRLEHPRKEPGKEDEGKEALKAQRKKRLETNVHAPGKQGGPSGTPPDDYEAAFDFYAKKSDSKKRKEGLI